MSSYEKDNFRSSFNRFLFMNKGYMNKPLQYKPLKRYSPQTMEYVVNDWHHACLSYLNATPTKDYNYNDLDYDMNEIIEIIYNYGIAPEGLDINNLITDF